MKTAAFRSVTTTLIVLAAALVIALQTPAAAALISLNRSPEPPLCVANNGLEAEAYDYRITFSTIANYYSDVIRDPNGVIVRGIFYDCTGNNAGIVPPGFTYVNLGPGPVPSPIVRAQTYNPGVGALLGRYEIEITFFSIQGGSAFEAKAAVTFYVCQSKGTLNITKFNDLNANGARDPGEPGIANWRINIQTPIGDTVGRLTNSSGVVNLSGVGTGTYVVTEVVQSGWKPTTPTSFTVVVNPSATTNVRFGNVQPIIIQGDSYNDLNCSGTYEPGEPLLTGVTFTLTDLAGNPVHDADGVLVAPQSDSGFNFTNLFPNLFPNQYKVTATDPVGYESTNAIPGGAWGTKLTNDSIRVNATTPNTTYGGTKFLDCAPGPSLNIIKTANPTSQYVGGTVTYTFTVQDLGNTPIQVTSLQDDKLGDLLNDFKAANGGSDTLSAGQTVTFIVTYVIQPTDPPTITNTVSIAGQDPFGTQLTDTDSESVTIIPPPPVSISGGVYDDLNCNGVYDPGDPPLAGATVTLTDLSSVFIASQPSPAFNFVGLAHGSYLVTVTTVAPGYQSTNAIPGTGGIKLAVNQIRVDATTPGLTYPNQIFLECVPNPAITITKSPSPTSGYDGTTVVYTFVVHNTGNTPLTVSINDTLLGNITSSFVAAHGGSDVLAAGQSVTFTANHAIVPANPDPLLNTVTATGTDPFGTVVTGNANASVGVLRPCIDITKTPVPSSGREGTLITYTFVVSNCGNRALDGVQVQDSFFGDLSNDFFVANGNSSTLALAGSVTFTKTHTLGPSDPTFVTNTVTASGIDPLSHTWTDSTSATVEVIRPCIDVEKTVTPFVTNLGQTLTYTFVITNCGNVAISLVTVSDTLLGPLTTDFTNHNPPLYNQTLAVGSTVTFTKTYLVAGETPNPIDNTVTVAGVDPISIPVSDSDSAAAHIPVTISGGAFYDVDGDGVLEPGDTPLPGATFTIKDMYGNNVHNIYGQCVCSQTGATFSFTNLLPGLYVVTETDPPLYTSTNALPGPGAVKLTINSIRVNAIPHLFYPNNFFLDTRLGTGSISGAKFDSDTSLPVQGVTIKLYDSSRRVVEMMLTDVNGAYSFIKLPADTYRVNETNPLGYEATGASPGPYANVIDFNNIRVPLPDSGDSPNNNFFDKRSGACINITKAVMPPVARVGDVVTYTFTVANCGLVALGGVTVFDDAFGDLTPDFIAANNGVDTLAVGVEVQFTVKYTVPGSAPSPMTNTVTATGYPPFGVPVVDTDTATVIIIHPCIKITKTATPSQVGGVGETVTYGFIVENCGDVALTNVTVIDTVLGDLTPQFIVANGGTDVLAPVASVSFTVNYTIPTGAEFPIVNTVTASGKDPTGGSQSSSDTAVVTLSGPCISVKVTADPTVCQIGDVVTFTVKICNCGNTPLNGITVTGAPCSGQAAPSDIFGDLTPNFVAANCGCGNLLVGKCVEFQLRHTIKATDPNPLCLKVTATGTVLISASASAEGQASVTIEQKQNRQCFLPVTFTPEGWSYFCDEVVYPRFARAFARFVYYGTPSPGRCIVGFRKTVTFQSITSALKRLCVFLPTAGPCGKLYRSYLNPASMTEAGILAPEAVCLMMNIAYNDERLMPRSPGYNLENFAITQGLYKGKRVGEVMDIANHVLGGIPPCNYGLPSCEVLVQILQSINADYEFVNFDTFTDRGYLLPNRALGPPDPPHAPVVP